MLDLKAINVTQQNKAESNEILLITVRYMDSQVRIYSRSYDHKYFYQAMMHYKLW